VNVIAHVFRAAFYIFMYQAGGTDYSNDGSSLHKKRKRKKSDMDVDV